MRARPLSLPSHNRTIFSVQRRRPTYYEDVYGGKNPDEKAEGRAEACEDETDSDEDVLAVSSSVAAKASKRTGKGAYQRSISSRLAARQSEATAQAPKRSEGTKHRHDTILSENTNLRTTPGEPGRNHTLPKKLTPKRFGLFGGSREMDVDSDATGWDLIGEHTLDALGGRTLHSPEASLTGDDKTRGNGGESMESFFEGVRQYALQGQDSATVQPIHAGPNEFRGDMEAAKAAALKAASFDDGKDGVPIETSEDELSRNEPEQLVVSKKQRTMSKGVDNSSTTLQGVDLSSRRSSMRALDTRFASKAHQKGVEVEDQGGQRPMVLRSGRRGKGETVARPSKRRILSHVGISREGGLHASARSPAPRLGHARGQDHLRSSGSGRIGDQKGRLVVVVDDDVDPEEYEKVEDVP